MSALEPFDPATLPLTGVRLIEASAGTGKTASLAGLYLRLIAQEQADVRDILVVTFTRAATQELRERLRARLGAAARIAAAAPGVEPATAEARFAEAVVAGAGEARERVAARLDDAARRIDQATITTIHGFAHKAAAENAFESALPFDRGEQTDDAAIRREAAADYWRSRVFDVDAAAATAFTQLWGQPDDLYTEIAPALAQPHAHLRHPDPDAVAAARERTLRTWRGERAAFVELLERAHAEDACYANKELRSWLDSVGAEGLAQAIDRGLTGTVDGLPGLPAIVAALGDDDAAAGQIKKKPLASWCRPQDLSTLPQTARLQVDGRIAAAALATDAVRERSARLKRERRLYSFDDMITGLHAAVLDPERGPGLAGALRRTWPWALVDEFQDTDPLQYAILRRIYADPASADGDARSGLILIGDPKQAIYGFRGGDVFAYLEAAADADGHYGMDTNFRSSPSVIDGINTLFGGCERPFVLDGIAYRSIEAGRAESATRVTLDEGPIDGLTAWAVPAEVGINKEGVQSAIERATVARISALLDPARGSVVDDDEAARPVRPSEIAVLVNTNAEATAMQGALTGAGVPAVCIHQASVFATEAAEHVLHLLRAATVPYDRERLRLALTTPLFGQRLGDIAALDADEQQWTGWTETFQQTHLRWARGGVQAMAEPIIQAAAERVAALTDGERRLTDYLHVIERLQSAEHAVFGMAGLVRWLETAIEAAVGDGETAEADRLRLENDADLVEVTTVHKAKGLEFAIVLVPYAPWLGTGGGRPNEPPFSCHDDARRPIVDLGSVDAETLRPRAVAERRAEQVRALYVALTRAEQACVFAWSAARGSFDGPLSWLLHQPEGARPDQWHGSGRKPPAGFDAATAATRLRALAETSGGGFRVEALPADEPVAKAPPACAAETLGAARSDYPAPRPPWTVLSFSGLAGRMAAAAEPVAGADDTDTAVTTDEGPAEVALEPRGPAFGQAFHELVEAADPSAWPRPGDALPAAHWHETAAALRRHGVAVTDAAGHTTPVERTAALVAATLHAPLPEIGPLADVPAKRRRAEIEFFLRLGGSTAGQIGDALAEAGYPSGAGLETGTLRGLMQGFIDGVVEADGRYWVIDYKTNALGPRCADYAGDALAAAVRHHHYDLQYLIYTVALHRYLRRRLPDYDPARHLGGVQYLFVRALGPDDATGVYVDRPPATLIDRLDALFDAEGAPA